MAKTVINDWVVKVGFDSTEFNKGIKAAEKKVEGLAKRMARLQSKSMGSGTNRTQRARQPQGFTLLDDRQLKIANTIDSIVRRAERGLGKTSQDFKDVANSADILKRKIRDVDSKVGLEKLNNEIRKLRENTTAATARTRALTNAMQKQRFVANATKDSIRNLARSYVSVFAAVEVGRFVLNTTAQFDSLRASLLAASGDAETAAKDFEFIKRTSLGLGVQLSSVADGYRQIGAAGRFSNLTTEQTKDVFLAATEASRAFGLSADRTQLVYLAFSQILSKGKVSQEELRRQLGEQLPGAMAIAAKAMNVTTSELESMIQKGISAEEFLPKFAAELRSSVKDSGALAASLNTVTAAQQRLSSELQLGIVGFSDAGGKEGIISLFEGLSFVVKSLKPILKAIGIIFKNLGRDVRTILRIFGGLVNIITGLVKAFQSLNPEIEKTAGALENTQDKALGFLAIYESIATVADRVLGIVQLTVGLFERLIRGDFASFKKDYEALAASGGPSTNVGFLASSIPILGPLLTGADVAARQISGSSGTTTNNNQAVVNINGGDPVEVERVVKGVLQDTMKVSIN